MKHKKKIDEIVRFFTVGVLATGIQYGTYLLMIGWLHPLVANTLPLLTLSALPSTMPPRYVIPSR